MSIKDTKTLTRIKKNPHFVFSHGAFFSDPFFSELHLETTNSQIVEYIERKRYRKIVGSK